ncbi:MAG: SDR family oxidoreductase [Candidatus Omnitrophota bacterium]
MNQKIIITGASRGLGLALAQSFLKAGDSVIGITRSRSHWAAAKRTLSYLGEIEFYQMDVSDESSVRTFFSKNRKKISGLDILINNAGYGGILAPVEKLRLPELEKHIRMNLIGAFLMSQYAIPIMKKKASGCIVNISSMAGKRAVPRLFAYSAAKSGILALTQCLVKENENSGIRCLTVCPGGMNTTMRSSLFGEEDASKQQSAEFVAGILMDVLRDKIQVPNGGDIVIRHGKITAINPLPEA